MVADSGTPLPEPPPPPASSAGGAAAGEEEAEGVVAAGFRREARAVRSSALHAPRTRSSADPRSAECCASTTVDVRRVCTRA